MYHYAVRCLAAGVISMVSQERLKVYDFSVLSSFQINVETYHIERVY